MTPAEIAAKLTPAQVRALRDPHMCERRDWLRLSRFDREYGTLLIGDGGLSLARRQAVLAELDKETKK